jgi:hypothetical protein
VQLLAIDVQVIVCHTRRIKPRLERLAAGAPIEPLNAVDRFDSFVDAVDDVPRDSVFNNLGH